MDDQGRLIVSGVVSGGASGGTSDTTEATALLIKTAVQNIDVDLGAAGDAAAASDTSARSDVAAVRALQLKLDADSMRRSPLFAELAPLALPALERRKVLGRAAGVDDQGARNDVWV